jgi:serine/threonine-protein kinase
MSELQPGCVLGGKYVLRECIGEGGMGTVFLADQPALARQVAIKVLRPDFVSHRDLARRFREEAVAASRVRNPRSVAILDCSALPDGTPYIVMEYVRGRSLGRVIGEDDISLARAVELVQQILSALEAAHGAGVIHGDIKSENFLVEGVDDVDRVTMIDFGLARMLDASPEDDDRVSGTPEYMAPEVIRGQPAQRESDLYAVGVILYELLTGTTPFGGGASTEILARHLDDVVIPPSLRCEERDLPRSLDDVILRALAKDPAERFGSARAFADALAGACAGRKLPTARPSRHDIARTDSPTRNCGMPPPRTSRAAARLARKASKNPARGVLSRRTCRCPRNTSPSSS